MSAAAATRGAPPPPPSRARPRGRRRRVLARAPRASSATTSDADATRDVDDDDDEMVIRRMRAWCDATSRGVDASPSDVAAFNALVDAVVARTTTSASTSTSTSSLANTRWRLLGCAQRTLPSPGAWLASPFFWIAKEAQQESYRLATSAPDLFPPFKLAARLSAGMDAPKTGEMWIDAFGKREVRAGFPFGVIESFLNGFAVAFRAGDATLEFGDDDGDDGGGGDGETTTTTTMMTSRVRVDFGDGAVVGDLVTECVVGLAEETGGGDDATATTRRKMASLVSTRFENTGVVALDGVAVPSGAIMKTLMSPSPSLRERTTGARGHPGVPYAAAIVVVGGGTAGGGTAGGGTAGGGGEAEAEAYLVATAGSCEATSTALLYERVA